MALLRTITKSLFGLRDGAERDNGRDGEVRIKDGKVITHPENDQEITQPPPASPPAQDTQDEDEHSGEGLKQGRLPAVSRFWTFMEVAGRGNRTVKEYRWEQHWWAKQAQGATRTLYTLNVRNLEESLRGIHPATVRRKLAFLRVLGRWYLREGFPRLHTETGKVMSPRLPEKIPRDRGPEEFIELRDKAKKWAREGRRQGIWISLMLMSGLRISEIQTAQDSGDGKIRVLGKGQKERLVPVPGWVLKAMQSIPREGRGGWAQGRGVVWKGLKKAGVGKPHSLRHTYASELMRRGRRIEEIQVLLGHASVATTNIYAKSQVPAGVAELLDKDT